MIVFITGASAGFGAEMARTFARNGHRVVLAARRTERIAELAAELGDAALPVTLDVTSRASIDAALAALPPDWRAIDVLVNNAGLALNTLPAHEVPLEDWETMIATNCQGLVTMTRAVLPGMSSRGKSPVTRKEKAYQESAAKGRRCSLAMRRARSSRTSASSCTWRYR